MGEHTLELMELLIVIGAGLLIIDVVVVFAWKVMRKEEAEYRRRKAHRHRSKYE